MPSSPSVGPQLSSSATVIGVQSHTPPQGSLPASQPPKLNSGKLATVFPSAHLALHYCTVRTGLGDSYAARGTWFQAGTTSTVCYLDAPRPARIHHQHHWRTDIPAINYTYLPRPFPLLPNVRCADDGSNERQREQHCKSRARERPAFWRTGVKSYQELRSSLKYMRRGIYFYDKR